LCVSSKNKCNYFYNRLPSLTFSIDSITYEIPASGYLVNNLGGDGNCGIAVTSTTESYVILG
jgi:hypothetical protein